MINDKGRENRDDNEQISNRGSAKTNNGSSYNTLIISNEASNKVKKKTRKNR